MTNDIDELFDELTIPVAHKLCNEMELRALSRETFRVLIELERMRGYNSALEDGHREQEYLNQHV